MLYQSKNNIYDKMKEERTCEILLEIAKRIAKQRKGALFVVTSRNKFKGVYEQLFPQIHIPYIIDKKGIGAIIEKLATLDASDGRVVAYGVRLKFSKAVRGFGTRHAAASGITNAIKNSTAILVSEEVNWIKVFKNGRLILEMDPAAETSVRVKHKITRFITDNDTALLTAAGASAVLLGAGPVLVVGGTYLAVRGAAGIIRKKLSQVK